MPPVPRMPGFLVSLRGALWRWRHVFGVLALTAALLSVIEAVRPDDDRTPLLVAARELPAGHILSPDDVRMVPSDLSVAHAYASPDDVLGAALAVGAADGAPILPGMVVGSGLAEAAPAGHTLVTVTLADPGSAALAEPGRTVSLIGASEWSEGEVLTRDAVVMAHVAETESASFLQTVQNATFLVVAVPDRTATVVLESSAAAPLRVALSSSG